MVKLRCQTLNRRYGWLTFSYRIQLDLTTSEAEKLLQTEYYYFEHAPTGKMAVGCDG